jgi:hypothetical protein
LLIPRAGSAGTLGGHVAPRLQPAIFLIKDYAAEIGGRGSALSSALVYWLSATLIRSCRFLAMLQVAVYSWTASTRGYPMTISARNRSSIKHAGNLEVRRGVLGLVSAHYGELAGIPSHCCNAQCADACAAQVLWQQSGNLSGIGTAVWLIHAENARFDLFVALHDFYKQVASFSVAPIDWPSRFPFASTYAEPGTTRCCNRAWTSCF